MKSVSKDLTGEEKVKRNSMAAGRDPGRCFILCADVGRRNFTQG